MCELPSCINVKNDLRPCALMHLQQCTHVSGVYNKQYRGHKHIHSKHCMACLVLF